MVKSKDNHNSPVKKKISTSAEDSNISGDPELPSFITSTPLRELFHDNDENISGYGTREHNAIDRSRSAHRINLSVPKASRRRRLFSPTRKLGADYNDTVDKIGSSSRTRAFMVSEPPLSPANSVDSSRVLLNEGIDNSISSGKKSTSTPYASGFLSFDEDMRFQSPNLTNRSNKFISYISSENIDEFSGIQKGLDMALNNANVSWLQPNINHPTIIEATENDEDTNSLQIYPWRTESFSENENRKRETIGRNSGRLDIKNLKRSSMNKYRDSKDTDIAEEIVYDEVDDVDDKNGGGDKENSFHVFGKTLYLFSGESKIRLFFINTHSNFNYHVLQSLILIIFIALLSTRVSYADNNIVIYDTKNAIDWCLFSLNLFFTVDDLTKIIAFGFYDDSEMREAHGKPYKSIIDHINESKLILYLKKLPIFEFLLGYIYDQVLLLCNYVSPPKDKVKFCCKTKHSENDICTRRAYIRSIKNVLDFISIVSYWIGAIISLPGNHNHQASRLFRALSTLRIFSILNIDKEVLIILKGIKLGLPQLLTVGSMVLYFWIFFGIVGVQIFQGSFSRQCVWTNPTDPNDTYRYDMKFCGGSMGNNSTTKLSYRDSNGIFSNITSGFLCPVNSYCISDINPYNNRVSFDNLVNSMELIFVIMSTNTFTDLMYYMTEAESLSSSIFFIVTAFIMSIWLLNLLIAVLVSSFESAKSEDRNQKRSNSIKFSLLTFPKRISAFCRTKASKKTLPRWSKKLIQVYQIFEWMFVDLIIISLIILSLVQSSSSMEDISYMNKGNLAINAILLGESIFRLFVYIPNLWKFIIKLEYVFDLLVSVISLATFISASL
ncbi:hypothetical protein Kpol_1010p54, partial [Vanderwaltozyma polyspora DSM 70294]